MRRYAKSGGDFAPSRLTNALVWVLSDGGKCTSIYTRATSDDDDVFPAAVTDILNAEKRTARSACTTTTINNYGANKIARGIEFYAIDG